MKNIGKFVLIAALGATGCTQVEEKEDYKIGITYYDSYDPFITELSKTVEDNLNTYGDVIVKSQDSEKSQSKQNRQVSDMLEDGYDVICVNLVDRTAPKKIINMAQDYDVPIIFFNRELVSQDLESWTKLYYVGAPAEQSGQLQGELVAEYIQEHPEVDKNNDGKIQYVVLEGEAGHQDSIVRTDVSVETMSEAGIVMDKLDFAIANWNQLQAYTQTKQFLEKEGNEIELILSNNDEMALGAALALEESDINREDWPILVGVDGTKQGLEAVKNGTLIGTVYNDGIAQAQSIADLSVALAKQQSLKSMKMQNGKYIRHPYIKITSENVDDYLKLVQ